MQEEYSRWTQLPRHQRTFPPDVTLLHAYTDVKNHRGTGYIGSFTTLALLEHGYKVVIVDSLYNSSKVSLDRIELLCGKRPDFYQVDVTDEEGLDKVFAAHPNIDSVIHFAALKVCTLQAAPYWRRRKLIAPGCW